MALINKSMLALDKDFFAKFKTLKRYKKNQIIIKPGEKPSEIFYVKSGFVRLYLISNEGKELTFNIFKPDTYFSMIWALNESVNIYFFECITSTVILKAPIEKVTKYIEENPAVLYDLTKRTLSGLEGMTKLMDALLSKNAYHQIMFVLLILALRFGKKKNNYTIIDLPLTHRLIGTLAGLSREATSREIEKLTKEKIISQINHKIVVKNIKKLEEEAATISEENIIF